MGVRGLLNYVLRHRERGTTQRIDLVREAQNRERQGVTLLVDLLDFAAWFLPQVDQLAKEYEPDSTFLVYGGEFVHHDEALSSMVFSLRNAGIYLDFFVDTPRGCGLVDGVVGNASDDAKRKCSQYLEAAKAVRQWCRGERSDLPEHLDELRCPPALWYDQLRATLARCGCQIWHLRPEEQAPLLSLGRNSDLSHIWGVVSDNIDWAVVRGIRLVPMTCFDCDQDIRPAAMYHGEMGGWPQVHRLSVAYTNSDLLAEHLRLGHPPKEEDMREGGKAQGKGKRPVGFGSWPFKWWFDQALVELSMLLGTDATTSQIQKHKLYAQLGLQMGADPVDSIVRWVRNQLYTNKLRWRDMQLEGLSPVIADLVEKDREFELALKCARSTYAQSANGVRAVQAELAKLGKDSSSSSKLAGEQIELPEASSLFLRSAALSEWVWLDVSFEDVARNGAPLAEQLLGDLRRLTYLLLRRNTIQEHGVLGEQRGAVSSHTVDLASGRDTIKDLQAIQHWPIVQRWGVFRKIVEHNSLQAEAAKAQYSEEGAALPPVEACVWDAYRVARDGGPPPPRADGCFLAALLEYFASMNLRHEKPLIREHEFDSVALMLALSYDVCLPGSPLGDANDYEQHRLGEIKAHLYSLLAYNFHSGSDFHLPMRAVAVGSWLQAAARHLLDVARLLRLDVEASGETPVFLPEPREIFSGGLLAAIYLGGAYDEWEVQIPSGDSQYRWKGFLRQLSALRHEALNSNSFWHWKNRLMQGFRAGSVSWPTREQVETERKQRGGQGQEELPIDEHRDRILKHVESHRVTCIQGETGCGKSTRVPVYIMEDYFEKVRNGQVKSEDPFMVLCTQPRRIACISLANRVATCLKERVGDTIGYKISGDSCVRPGRTKLVYVTTGYLLQVLVNNPEQIRSYTHLVLDEVHERDVDSDLLSLVVKLQMASYNFKLVIMSATLQGDLFTRYFSDKKTKTIFVGVKRYPVEVLYVEQLLDRYGGRNYGDFGDRRLTEGTRGITAPFSSQAMRAMRDAERCFGTGGQEALGAEEEEQRPTRGEFDDSSTDEDDDEEEGVEEKPVAAQAAKQPKRWRKEVSPNILRGLDILVYEIISRVAQPGEGILIFLPGIGEITELHETLLPLEDSDREAHMSWDPSVPRPDCRFKVFVLHSLIPKDEQEGAVFDAPPSDTAHVILASNIAESSLTIPKVRVVIDFGLRRQLVYDKRRHMSCLVTAWVSQASAKQRIGRTGRVFEGVAIRLFTKQFHDAYLQEFDPPEMQTAPLEKLYVNVKHLSSKLPEYQISPNEKRKRTPKELLQLTAQPPETSSIEASIEVLDQLGALSSRSESAELTVLGYLMMSVPLDVHLCRLVIFGALLGIPCEGVICASSLSVQDPFTLPSHLIIKDPREYAEALRRSYETRFYFDHGHCSEPLMLRSLFVHWLTDFRKMMVDRCGRRGYRNNREPHRVGFLRCSQAMAQKFAVVPKRLVHLATAVLDTATRTRKYIPQGSPVLKQLDALVALLQAGDKWFGTPEEADSGLPKVEDLFCNDHWKLKSLLVMAFTPQFMMGSTKVRAEEATGSSWKRKKQDKSKIELLLDEIIEQGLDPAKTVACVVELPRGRNSVNRWHPRFLEDLKLTLEMITCGEKFSLVMSGDNKVLISFESESSKSAFEGLKVDDVAQLAEESGLVQDLPMGAHFIDLYGAGRWKFTVPMLNSLKAEREKAEKEEKERKEREAKEKETRDREAREKEKKEREAREKERKEKEKREREAKERERKEKEAAEKERKEKEAAEKERQEKEAAEKERKEKEAAEKERKEKEAAEKERKEKDAAEKEEGEKEAQEKEVEEPKAKEEEASQAEASKEESKDAENGTDEAAEKEPEAKEEGAEEGKDQEKAEEGKQDAKPDTAEESAAKEGDAKEGDAKEGDAKEAPEEPPKEPQTAEEEPDKEEGKVEEAAQASADAEAAPSKQEEAAGDAQDSKVDAKAEAANGHDSEQAPTEEAKPSEEPPKAEEPKESKDPEPPAAEEPPKAEEPKESKDPEPQAAEEPEKPQESKEAEAEAAKQPEEAVKQPEEAVAQPAAVEPAPAQEVAEENAEEGWDGQGDASYWNTVDDPSELGPLIGIYKPVTPYEVNWEIIEQDTSSPAAGMKKGAKVKTKRRVTKGRCSWRNPIGFLGSCRRSDPDNLEPWPNDVLAVYTTMQGGDSKELSWVDGVTLLSADGDGLTSFMLLIVFLRAHQELTFEVDLQTGRVLGIRSIGGLEFRPAGDQILLLEDVLKINAVRAAASEAFHAKASPVPSTVEKDEGVDFSGTRGRRDEEPVPQIAMEPRLSEALDELMAAMTAACSRGTTIDEATWSQRRVLRKPNIQIIDMHRDANRSVGSVSEGQLFRLFTPLCDIVQMKRDAEQQQSEEEERRRRFEEEKRRRKDDERRRKEEERKQKKVEEQRRREEERRSKAEMKRSGKGKGKAEPQQQQQQYQPEGGGKGKGKKGKQQQQQQQQQQYEQQQQMMQQQEQQQKSKRDRDRGRKGRKTTNDDQQQGNPGGFAEPSQLYGVGYVVPNLPQPWVAVPDSASGRLYYWNQDTNEVSWTPPVQASPGNARSSQSSQNPSAFGRQQQPDPQQQQSTGSSSGMWPDSEYGFMQQQQQQQGLLYGGASLGYPNMGFPYGGQRASGQSHLDWQ